MRIDSSRAKEVFGHMLTCYRERRHPFIDLEADLPQTIILQEVKDDKRKLALHLFYSCHYMRGTVISSHAFKVLNEHQLEFPWLFEPAEVVKRDLLEIQMALASKIPWQQVQVAQLWRDNSQTLLDEWDGDPRNIFKGVTAKETLYRRVMGAKYKKYRKVNGKNVLVKSRYRGFGGFLEKMTSMLAYFLEAMDLIEPTALSAPVDFHHLRIYLANEMIVVPGNTVRYETIKPYGIKLAEMLQREFGLSQVEYGDIIWLWSLRLCRNAPYNASKEITNEEGKEVRVPIPVTWTGEQETQYRNTCGTCAIESFCKHGVPAGVYYTRGIFQKLRREDPPFVWLPVDFPVMVKPNRGKTVPGPIVSGPVPDDLFDFVQETDDEIPF